MEVVVVEGSHSSSQPSWDDDDGDDLNPVEAVAK